MAPQFFQQPDVRQWTAPAQPEPAITFATSQILESDIGLQSDAGVRFAWALQVRAVDLAGESFLGFYPRSWLLQTRNDRYVNLYPRWVGSTGRELADGLQTFRIGPTPESVNGLSGERNRSLAHLTPPDIDGHRFIGGAQLVFRPGSADFAGLWRSVAGDRTLIATFDNVADASADGPAYDIVASTAFRASAISTNGSHHHEQPTWLVLASDPDEAGTFGLVMLHWPKDP